MAHLYSEGVGSLRGTNWRGALLPPSLFLGTGCCKRRACFSCPPSSSPSPRLGALPHSPSQCRALSSGEPASILPGSTPLTLLAPNGTNGTSGVDPRTLRCTVPETCSSSARLTMVSVSVPSSCSGDGRWEYKVCRVRQRTGVSEPRCQVLQDSQNQR